MILVLDTTAKTATRITNNLHLFQARERSLLLITIFHKTIKHSIKLKKEKSSELLKDQKDFPFNNKTYRYIY